MQIEEKAYNCDSPFTFMGKVEFIGGNRVITNKQGAPWIKACYYKDQQSVYIVEKFLKDEFDRDYGWHKSWSGQKYVNNKLVYTGPFQVFYKHTEETQEGTQYTYEEDGVVKSTYKGGFKYDNKHGDNGCMVEGEHEYRGRWERGYRQGKFTVIIQNPNTAVRIRLKQKQVYFFNDLSVGNQPPDKIFQKDEKCEFLSGLARHGIAITEGVTKSLQPKQWLTSTAVDLFMSHLEKSYKDSQRKKTNVKFMKVGTFQNMIDSNQIESDKPTKIKYSAIENYGKPYKNITSIFHKYPLIILPFNINSSHFALCYILTETQFQNYQLKSVKFQLAHMDSLSPEKEYIFLILKEYIEKEISTNIHPAEQNLYRDALRKTLSKQTNNIKTSANLNFTHQKNSHDCGIFTCMYTFLLAAQHGLSLNVNWNFPQRHIDQLRNIIAKDAWYGVPSLLDLLIQKFISKK